ncbi:DUF2515 family protein [Ornithinibacillus contaminans]|uniref:DUF2515 family protein n=1 Tax=Ornithinibacillus contaminans TaxID=694055 RepID=UPI0012ECEDDF|nr:DUF2515 family protein [Ornithinibacillus contaminans]
MRVSWHTQDYLYYITNRTRKYNIDNIARTKAYQSFYKKHPEIKWALVASVVSRNAGWNMTDLYTPTYKQLLKEQERKRLFMTYERANWLIFSDAYPQLVVYELSTKLQVPLFHLLQNYHVSQFMIREWERFWVTKDEDQLLISLIINEQNVIQHPVITQSFFRRHIFLSLPYLAQDVLLLNAVLIPTTSGNLYGDFVHKFTHVSNRITLGKSLASQMFHPAIFPGLLNFITKVEHTGSRQDYEVFLPTQPTSSVFLRTTYPIIEHQDIIRKDWYKSGGIKQTWYQLTKGQPKHMGKSFYQKRKWIATFSKIKNSFT